MTKNKYDVHSLISEIVMTFSGDYEEMRRLMQNPKYDINQPGRSGANLLFWALVGDELSDLAPFPTEAKYPDVAKLFLKMGVSVGHMLRAFPPLKKMVLPEFAQKMAIYDGKENERILGVEEGNFLSIIQQDDVDSFQKLFEQAPFSFCAPFQQDQITKIAMENQSVEIMKYLIQHVGLPVMLYSHDKKLPDCPAILALFQCEKEKQLAMVDVFCRANGDYARCEDELNTIEEAYQQKANAVSLLKPNEEQRQIVSTLNTALKSKMDEISDDSQKEILENLIESGERYLRNGLLDQYKTNVYTTLDPLRRIDSLSDILSSVFRFFDKIWAYLTRQNTMALTHNPLARATLNRDHFLRIHVDQTLQDFVDAVGQLQNPQAGPQLGHP